MINRLSKYIYWKAFHNIIIFDFKTASTTCFPKAMYMYLCDICKRCVVWKAFRCLSVYHIDVNQQMVLTGGWWSSGGGWCGGRWCSVGGGLSNVRNDQCQGQKCVSDCLGIAQIPNGICNYISEMVLPFGWGTVFQFDNI